jgi:glycosyltransferase involved in cell wall biosynthesis
MLLTNQIDLSPCGGREMLCKLNHEALLSIFGERLVVFELPLARPTTPRGIFNAFHGHIDGLTSQTINAAIDRIQREKVRQVFVDGSNLGGFVAVLKCRLTHVYVTSFFHNVEARFFWGALATSKTPRALAVFMVNFLAERKAVRLSDKRICLSERDSTLLKKLYGKGATHIAPMALHDQLPDEPIAENPSNHEAFALFVGGNFYANRDGIAWFVHNVVPHIDIKICIVGKGMEDLRMQLEVPGRVEVIGLVDNLSDLYRRARCVIAPIFDGSGMKTKVAEALMHGKRIVGTPEAFSGYENIASKVGWCCKNAKEFTSALNEASASEIPCFDKKLRAIYLENYSYKATKQRLDDILNDT